MTGTCQDCGATIHQQAVRCKLCAQRRHSLHIKAAWARGAYGEETLQKMSEVRKAAHARGIYANAHNPEAIRKHSEAMRVAHARGDFSGMFTEEVRHKMSEGIKASWARGDYDSEETRQKYSENAQERWANGVMDTVFKSPSRPELAIAQALDDLGIKYQQQYRLKGDGRPFDFYIPPDMLIEVDGTYWHDDTKHSGIAAKDAAKSVYAEERGYTLRRITDQEIVEVGAAAILAEKGI